MYEKGKAAEAARIEAVANVGISSDTAKAYVRFFKDLNQWG